jgi:hypothetical protein
MELIERYIHEVGRYLPGKNRADIQAELRSLLSDALEDQVVGEPDEAAVKKVLKEFGTPRSVAAKYYPEGQYLIGPALFPLYQMIVGIVVAAVSGAQVLAWLVAYFIAGEMVNPLTALAGLITSIPTAVGWVTVVFFIMQRFDLRPDEPEEEWDPATLPQINPEEEVKRGDRFVSIVFETVILAVVILFPDHLGAYFFPSGAFFGNPVLAEYLGWISASLLISIAIDIYMVWQGRWTLGNRLATLGANLFSIAVLAWMVQAHTTWLRAHGVTSFTIAMEKLAEDVLANGQIVTMWAFWMAFSVALIVTSVETIVMVARLVHSSLAKMAPVKGLTMR